MFKPSLRSNWSLVVLAILAVVLYYFAQTSYKEIKVKWYDEKLRAAQLMEESMQVLKDEIVARGLEIDITNDPNSTGLIGPSVTSITTSRGILSEKLTAVNPNFAAVFIDYFEKEKLKEGDYVAVGITGSNPAINLALFSAIEVMKLKPVVATALGSASFGANRPEFNWLDMENLLYDKKLISFRSEAVSLGGGKDLGRGLAKIGRDTLESSIRKYNLKFIHGSSLIDNINQRMTFYEESISEGEEYKLFINLGGALANVGDFINAKLIKNGLHKRLADKKFENEGVIMKFARKNVPVLHIYSVNPFAERFGLPVEPEMVPQAGTGKMFIYMVNNVTVAAICLGILLLAVAIVIIFDRKDRHFASNIVDPDQTI